MFSDGAKDELRRIEELRSEINFHNYRYHVLDEPVIGDSQFDQLLAQLRSLEEKYPEWVTPDSPTQRVGSQPAERFVKVEHPAPILSLANAFGADDVRAWYERLFRLDERVGSAEYVLEPKIDGLSVVLHYRDGVFVQGATRGNGEVGEEITSNLRTIRTLPLRLPVNPNGPAAPPYLVVRGEAFISIEDFEALNHRLEEAGEKTYLNPRNTAAGSLRQLDPALTASRPLNLLVYDIVAGEGEFPTTQWERLAYLRSLGFPVAEISSFHDTLEDVINKCLWWADRREGLPYEADGFVIKINNLSLAADLGFVGKDPRGAIAYKYPSQEVVTRLEEIGVNVGRTGVLTPYAMLSPVDIGGVVVRQATLHNFDYIAEKDIRVGDQVRVKRAGEVIPYVIGPVDEMRRGDERVYNPPERCPACDEPVENFAGEVAWYCVNAVCPAQLIRNLEHYVSRGAMDIVGLGIKIVEQLVESGLVQDVAGLYSLKRDDLLALEGFKDKKVDNLLGAIDRSRQQPLERLIIALGIRGVGEAAAGDLTRYYADLDAIGRASADELQAIEGFGPNIAQAIVDWYARPANQRLLEKLKKVGVWPSVEIGDIPDAGELPLDGMVFVITGTLPDLSRSQAKALIQEHGGKVTGSVSKKTTYLLAGESAGSKLEKAQSLGVPVLDWAALLAMLADPELSKRE